MLPFGPKSRRMFQLASWFIAFACLGAAVSGQTSEITGTLPEDYLPGLKSLLATAVSQSPQVLLHQIQIARSEARVYDADSRFWPNVSGNMRYDSNQTGVSGNSAAQTRNSGLFYSFSADQAVFHWGAIKNNSRIAKIEVAIAKDDYADGYRMLAVQIRQSYLDLVARQARLRATEYDLKLKQADLATAKQQVANGSMSASQYGGMQLDFTQNQIDAERQQLDFDGHRRQLARLAGLSDLPADQIPYEVPVPRYDANAADQLLAAMLRDGGKQTIQAQEAQLRINEAELNYKIARVRLLPKFNAGLSHSRESSTTATPNEVSQTAITQDTLEVRGDWTIFDGFATKAAKLSALADKRQWQRQLQITADSAMDQAQQLQRTVALDKRAMDIAEQRLGLAQALLRLRESEMKAGRAAQSDVNDALRNLRNFEANAAYYRTNFLSDWAAFISQVTEDPALNNLPSRYVVTR